MKRNCVPVEKHTVIINCTRDQKDGARTVNLVFTMKIQQQKTMLAQLISIKSKEACCSPSVI